MSKIKKLILMVVIKETFCNFAILYHFNKMYQLFRIFTVTLLFSLPIFSLSGQQKENIFEVLSKNDSTGGTVVFHQDERIETLLTEKRISTIPAKTTIANGYRVQVFSSNEPRTAKNEAFNIERLINETFPEYGVYVTYSSPFWKVRVGDFASMEEAQAFKNELIEVFPQLRNQTYVVRDQINK